MQPYRFFLPSFARSASSPASHIIPFTWPWRGVEVRALKPPLPFPSVHVELQVKDRAARGKCSVIGIDSGWADTISIGGQMHSLGEDVSSRNVEGRRSGSPSFVNPTKKHPFLGKQRVSIAKSDDLLSRMDAPCKRW